jgi:oxygen-independent coproporphyrinogen-3 oxidase
VIEDTKSLSDDLQLPPLSLYVHIPWCVKKCPYCDFNSHEPSNIDVGLPEKEYLKSLFLDLDRDLDRVQGRKLHSVFFGGGTPSLFSATAIEKILNYVEEKIGFESAIEITLEANPGTFEQDKFSDFYTAGVNRLSIGVQSFNNDSLERLGRIHNGSEAVSAVAMAKRSGFNNINLDLMHGLPDQSIDQALTDLQTAIDLEPQHISWYQLTIEPNTVFYRHQPILPVEDILADIQDNGFKLLKNNGFQQYEVSAFARDKALSKHNLNYWLFGDYLGIGAGAHGKITHLPNKKILRQNKTRLPKDYMNGDDTPAFKEKPIDKSDIPLEFFMNTLRLNTGFEVSLFDERTGISFKDCSNKIQELIDEGLLEAKESADKSTIRTSPLGRRFLNTVLARLSG